MGANTGKKALTAQIVAAYVRNHTVAQEDLPALMAQVYSALGDLDQLNEQGVLATRHVPAVAVEDSITDDYIVCLEDGEKFKSLKRHLRTRYDMSPDQYKTKWGLPKDYPMVAPNYAQTRSDLAKQMGLGQKERGSNRSS